MRKDKAKKTELKAMRLNSTLVKTVNDLAEKENRNFSNMVETLLYKATQEVQQV